MADELDKLFSKIEMGADLLSPSDLSEFSNALCASKTKALLAEALVDFDDRKVEDEEWGAFHARTFRQEVLDDLRHSRLSSAEPEVDALLSQHNVSLDQGSALYKQLCRATLQGLADFYGKAEIILKGGLDDPRVVAEQKVVATQISSPDACDLTFGIAIEKYLSDQKINWGAKQFKSQTAKLEYFLIYLSEANSCDAMEVALSSVTNSMARSGTSKVRTLHCVFLLGTSKLLRSKRLSKLLEPFLAIAELVGRLSNVRSRYSTVEILLNSRFEDTNICGIRR